MLVRKAETRRCMEKKVRLTVKLVNLQKKTLGLDLPKRNWR